ncbi:hypothetical protein COCVIDRAFT_94199 [Bipolaris victoriae FI3]|uniref:Uncharacterized protein n=1 Tax=Bipolaris victoriae (strain FI3) TaxID=930091 RepID=W7EEH3_BIPV3|nr:hypothetical protein COCVIDRAFT_94199 [Bipolaris victoriae FI3]
MGRLQAPVSRKWAAEGISVEYGRELYVSGTRTPASPASLQHLHIPRRDAFATWAIHTSAKAVGIMIAAELGQEDDEIDSPTDVSLVKTASLSCSGVSAHQADISSLQNQSRLLLSKPPISPSSHPK